MQRDQFGPGVEAQLVGQPVAQLAVRGQRLALPPGPVQGAHVNGAQPFPERMASHEVAKLADEQPVLAQLQARLRVLLQRRQPLLLQAVHGRARVLLVGEVRVRGPAPQRQRVGQQPGPGARALGALGPGQQLREPYGVESAFVGAEQVAGGAGHDEVLAARLGVLERLAQLRDAHLQRARRVARRLLAPQVVHEPVGGDGVALVDEQVDEERPDLEAGDRHDLPRVGPDGQRPQHPEFHGVTLWCICPHR